MPMPMQPAEIVEPLNEPSALAVVGTLVDDAATETVGVTDKSNERKFGFVLWSMDSVRVPASRTSMEACNLQSYMPINKGHTLKIVHTHEHLLYG